MKKKQVLVVKGGDAFESYEKYIEFLKNYEIDESEIEGMRKRKWKDNLQENLGDDFEIIYPKMPCDYNAQYLEWKIWMEKFFPYLKDGIILIGHSMGGIFLTKYLSENIFPVKISQLHLVATPFEDNKDESGKTENYTLCSFKLKNNLSQVVEQVEKIILYQSKDDPIVPFEDMEKYKKELPRAKVEVFEDRGHFSIEEFPELVENIKNN